MLHVVANCSACAESFDVLFVSPPRTISCPKCERQIVSVEERDGGFVYVLSNPAMPELVKIGMTRRPIEERLSELAAATGVPIRFELEACFLTDAPEVDEAAAHAALAACRLEGREFFKCTVEMAVTTVTATLKRSPLYSRFETQPPAKMRCAECWTPQEPPWGAKQFECKVCHSIIDRYGKVLVRR